MIEGVVIGVIETRPTNQSEPRTHVLVLCKPVSSTLMEVASLALALQFPRALFVVADGVCNRHSDVLGDLAILSCSRI